MRWHGREVEGVVPAEFSQADLILEAGHLFPAAIRFEQEMRVLAAIAIGHGGKQPATVLTGMKFNLRNAGQAAAELIGVLFQGGAQSMKIDLLVEIQVLRRAFAGMGVTGVIKPAVIAIPRHAAATGGILHAGNLVGQLPAGGDIVNVNGAVFAAILRK